MYMSFLKYMNVLWVRVHDQTYDVMLRVTIKVDREANQAILIVGSLLS